jgi:hypothetical protein
VPRENQLLVVRAFCVALFLAGCMVGLDAAEIPAPDICDWLDNEWLRWLAGCPPLDSGAS